MEGLRKRVFGLGVLMLVVGGLVLSVPGKKPEGRTERWMETQAPRNVGDFLFVPGRENPEQTFPANEKSYRLLAPFGIVSRLYRSGDRQYEAVLIASNNRGSFHDPRVCFAGQGWNFDQQRKAVIRTRNRGDITVTLISGLTPENTPQYAVYFYRGPGGFSSSTMGIKARLMFGLLLHPFDGPGEAVFYRFVSQQQQAKEEEFLAFVSRYMDAAYESSGGYF